MTIRFIAVAGYIDKITTDGRILEHTPGVPLAPEDMRSLMVHDHSRGEHVGRIDRVSLIGDQIVLIGILFEDSWARPSVDALRAGTDRLNLDVGSRSSSWDSRDSGKPFKTYAEVMRIHDWWIRAAHVHSNPCWPLPAADVWADPGC